MTKPKPIRQVNKLHRENGELHREDGPAVEYDSGYKAWYIHGKCHREDGPAIIKADGTKEWWLNGEFINRDCEPENWDDLVKLAQVKWIMDE